jgi:hypothetical protein
VLFEKGHRPRPGKFRRFRIIARLLRIVVEGVIGPLIDMQGIFDIRCLQSLFVIGQKRAVAIY